MSDMVAERQKTADVDAQLSVDYCWALSRQGWNPLRLNRALNDLRRLVADKCPATQVVLTVGRESRLELRLREEALERLPAILTGLSSAMFESLLTRGDSCPMDVTIVSHQKSGSP